MTRPLPTTGPAARRGWLSVSSVALGSFAIVLSGSCPSGSSPPSPPTSRPDRDGGLDARIGLLCAGLLFAAQFAASTYVAPYLQDLVTAGPATVTFALLLFGLAGIAGNVVAGLALGRSVLGTTATAQVVLAAAVVLLPLLVHSTPAVLALVVVWGFAWGGLPLAMQTWMSTASAAGPETGLALFVTTIQLAIALGSVLGGAAVTAFGIAADFWLAGGIAFVGAVVFVALGPQRAATAPTESTSAGAHDRASASTATQIS